VFPKRIRTAERTWNLASRRFCPDCSPLWQHNRRTYVVAVEPGKAFCARCREHKNRAEFHSRKNGKPLSYCRSCSEEVKELKLQEKLERAVAAKGGVCADCANSFPTSVFVFCSDGKILPLGEIKLMSWMRFQRILNSCDMLCRNCLAMRKWEASR
jgi:hypothetical protein